MNAITQSTTTRVMFLLFIALALYMFGTSYAEAGLPNLPTPEGIDGSAVEDGDWLGAMGGWFKKGVTILGLVLAGLGFLIVVSGALSKWKEYSTNRANIGDLKEYMIMAAVFAVFLVVMVTYAFEVFAP